MIKRVDHVAIVVRNLNEALNLYEDLFGTKASRIETVPDQGVKTALIPIGDTEIEMLEPIDPNAGVAKFLESRGEGLHHISFEVKDVDAELKALGEKGVRLVDKEGREGVAGKIGFLHPSAAKGVLIELVQKV